MININLQDFHNNKRRPRLAFQRWEFKEEKFQEKREKKAFDQEKSKIQEDTLSTKKKERKHDHD